MNRISKKWMVGSLVVIASNTPTATKSAPSVTIGTYKTPEDGTLITGAENRTVYVFKPDE